MREALHSVTKFDLSSSPKIDEYSYSSPHLFSARGIARKAQVETQVTKLRNVGADFSEGEWCK